MIRGTTKFALCTILLGGTLSAAFAAGPPLGTSPVDTGSLPSTGEEWLTVNPYRAETAGQDVWLEALAVGESGYAQNCARCHGIEAVSGGLAPDLRLLEAEEYGDAWFAEKYRTGATQNNVTKMPAFGEILGQDAAWAIRTYVETRPDDLVMVDFNDELRDLRDTLSAYGEDATDADLNALRARLTHIAAEIPTISGAPVSDSIAYRAANMIDGTTQAYAAAAETLTIGLSAAR